MAVTYGFYDSVGGDRKYNAEEFSRLFDGIIVDGVFHSVGDIFKVKPGTGLQVIIGTGRAWFDGTWTYNDADLPISLESPDVLGRIDAVVIEVNRDILHRKNEIKIIKGTPSTKPIKPTLTNTDVLSQHALAYITVKSDAASIDVTNIEGVVGKSECPFVTGPLTTVDVDYLFSTWEGDFNEWFETVKDILSGDVAGNLLNEINKVREESAYNTHCAIGDIITSNRKDFYPILTNPNFIPCDGRIISADEYPELTSQMNPQYATLYTRLIPTTSLEEIKSTSMSEDGIRYFLLGPNDSSLGNSIELHKYNPETEKIEKLPFSKNLYGYYSAAMTCGLRDNLYIMGSTRSSNNGPFEVYHSNDAGKTWTLKSTISGVGFKSINMYYDRKLRRLFRWSSIGSYDPPLYNWYYSDDDGTTWTQIEDFPPEDRKKPTLAFRTDSKVYMMFNYSSSASLELCDLNTFEYTYKYFYYDENGVDDKNMDILYYDEDNHRLYLSHGFYTDDDGETWLKNDTLAEMDSQDIKAVSWIKGPENTMYIKFSGGLVYSMTSSGVLSLASDVKSPLESRDTMYPSLSDYWFEAYSNSYITPLEIYRVDKGYKIRNIKDFFVRYK